MSAKANEVKDNVKSQDEVSVDKQSNGNEEDFLKAPRVTPGNGLTGETKKTIKADGSEHLEYELDLNNQMEQIKDKISQLQGQLMMLNDIREQGIKLYATNNDKQENEDAHEGHDH